MEMESLEFAAFCHHVGIPSAVVCVTLLDRMQGDQVTVDKEEITSRIEQSIDFLIDFIQEYTQGVS